uniref:BAH domain-containing protein n=1 Tax=Anisakis simplex TaxID=6269 RepID=A0A0M3K847_ANISI
LNKTPSGNVEAKVLCYYRRRDISPGLLKVSDRAECVEDRALINTRRRLTASSSGNNKESVNGDTNGEEIALSEGENGGAESSENGRDKEANNEIKHESSESPKPMQVDSGEPEEDIKKSPEEKKKEPEADEDDDEKIEGGYGLGGLPTGSEKLTPKERHLLRHFFAFRQHELFLSRQVEALPATHIRGKCTVTLLSEVETPDSYLGKDDVFFYSLVYDPAAMTLLADKGEIRVGDKYQCEVPDGMEADALKEENKENGNLVIVEEELDGAEQQPVISTTEREVLVYHPHHSLTDRDIDQFLIIARYGFDSIVHSLICLLFTFSHFLHLIFYFRGYPV